jgi:mannose-P-dolichol utilization defect 1
MAGFIEVLISWVKLLFPDPCFDEFFVNYNFFHAACLKTVISKCLGYGIILGSIMVKVPQITKILSAKSAEGISIVSTTLELTAITGVLAYSYANGFPFSAYGEAIFLVIQTAIISFLVLTYTQGATVGVLYTAVYAAILAYLLSPMAPMSLLWGLQASVILLVVMARMIQAVTNYRNQSTGQLSFLTVALLFFGSVGRIFTSYQETGDMTVILTYCVSSSCNAFLLFQLMYYAKSTGKELPHVHKKKTK